MTSVSKGEYILSIDYTMAVSILMFIATSEITIVLIFLQLCAEVKKKKKKERKVLLHASILIFHYRIIIGGGNPS